MTLKGILSSLGQIAIEDRLCNWAGCGSSIYQVNPQTVNYYPFIFFSPTGTHRVENDYTTYSVTAFYVDRLMEDNSNDIDIQSASIEVLKNIVRKAEKVPGVVGIASEYILNIFVEYEKFADRCTGSYIQFEISVLNDSTCVIETGNYYLDFLTEQGLRLIYTDTELEIKWETNVERVFWFASTGEQGTTTGNSVTLHFGENTDTGETKEYLFGTYGFVDNTMVVNEEFRFIQMPAAYFNFTGPYAEYSGGCDQYETNFDIGSAVTSFTFTWETNIPQMPEPYNAAIWQFGPTSPWEPTLTGSAGETGVTIELPEAGDEDIQYFFEADFPINDFAHDCGFAYYTFTKAAKGEEPGPGPEPPDPPVVYYFNYTTQNYRVVSSGTTETSVYWDTNYPYIDYEVTRNGEPYTAQTNYAGGFKYIQFPANTETGGTNTFVFTAYYVGANLGSLTWYQNMGTNAIVPNTAITGDYELGAITSVTQMEPYGLYCFKWESKDQWFTNTPLQPTAFPEYEFGSIPMENGVVRQPYAQYLRVLRAVPMAETAISGETMYVRERKPGDSGHTQGVVYTGAAYVLVDTYTGKYFDFFGSVGAVFNDTITSGDSCVIVDCELESADSTIWGARECNQIGSNNYRPCSMKNVRTGHRYFGGTPKLTLEEFPYNYDTLAEWEEAKVTMYKLTEIQE